MVESIKMRAVVFSGLLALASTVFAQTSTSQTPDLFDSITPQVTLTVKEHPTGAEDVEVTLRDPKYPPDLLNNQLQELGRLLGSPPRGLAVFQENFGGGPEMAFLKARFAVNGLIDRQNGILNLEPIAKAFAGVPEPFTISGLAVFFEGEIPNDRTRKSFRNPGVEFEARFEKSPPLIEYHVRLLTQDAAKISIPTEQPNEQQKPVKTESSGPSTALVMTLVIVAALAVGALVYSFLLKRSLKTSR